MSSGTLFRHNSGLHLHLAPIGENKPLDFSASDLLKVAVIYLLTTGATLTWLFRSSQQEIARTGSAAVAIAVRILAVHVAIVLVFCGWMRCSVDRVLFWSPLILFLFALSFGAVFERFMNLISLFMDNLIVGAAVCSFLTVFVLPIYLLRQFVLDFRGIRRAGLNFAKANLPPERAPVPTLMKPASDDLIPNGTPAVVVATLRPLGKVRVNEKEMNARHRFGAFVEAGSVVEVAGQENGVLLIRESDG